MKTGETLIAFPSLTEGVLIKRYKRFLADIELDGGDVVTAHCANTGPMIGLLSEGCRVRLRYCPSPQRKLDWSWEQVKVFSSVINSGCWVGINTSLPNKIVRLAIESNCLLNELGHLESIRQEVTYGKDRKSRIDLLVEPIAESSDTRNIYIEVKNSTWTKGSTALFPDTITQRGQKHMRELSEIMPASRAVLVPCLSRNDVNAFAPGDSADSKYGELYREALKKGLEVFPCCFGFYRDRITWEGKKKFFENEHY